MIRAFLYVFACHLGWNCDRNFCAQLGCVRCHRTLANTLRGRRLK